MASESQKEYLREYYQKNKDKFKKYNKEHYQTSKEQRKKYVAQQNEWRHKKVEKMREQGIINPWSVMLGKEPKYSEDNNGNNI